MKKLLSIFTALALVLTLAGCGGEKPVDPSTPTDIDSIKPEDLKGVTIEYWHAQSKANGEAMQYLVDKFNKENEWGITVNASYQGSYNDIDTKITSALVSGTQPSVAQGYGNNIIGFMQSGQVICLNDYIDSKNYGMTEEEFNDILPGYRTEMAAFPDGKIYQVPSGKSTEMLFYNVDFFKENNLEVPTTLDELVDVARKATAITGKPSFGTDSTQNFFITMVQQFGGQYTTSDGKVLFGEEGTNLDATMAFLKWWKAGVDEGIFRLVGEDQYFSGPFANGDIPMFIGSTSGSAYIGDTVNWAPAFIPMGEHDKVMQQGANLFAMKTNDPKKDLAAYLFLEYMISAESSVYYALNTGYLPTRESARDLPEYKEFIESGSPVAQTKVLAASYPGDAYIFDPIFKESYPVRQSAGTIVEKVALLPKGATDDQIKQIVLDEYNKYVK